MYVCMIIYIYMSVFVLLIWLLDISEKKKRKKCVLYCMQTDWNISGSTCDCVSSLFWNQRIVTNHTRTTLPGHINHQTQQQQTQLIEFGLKRVKNRFQAANVEVNRIRHFGVWTHLYFNHFDGLIDLWLEKFNFCCVD